MKVVIELIYLKNSPKTEDNTANGQLGPTASKVQTHFVFVSIFEHNCSIFVASKLFIIRLLADEASLPCLIVKYRA